MNTKNPRDFSLIHELMTDLFSWPKSEKEWEPYKLSPEQIEFYHSRGYLAGIKLLNEKQVSVLQDELRELINPEHPKHDLFYEFHSNESGNPDQTLFHSLGHWRISPGFHDILWNPAFVMAASQLLGTSVRFWHDQLFYKPAKHGGVVAWHQDYSYWTRTQPMQHLTCWVGLDDTDTANGCLRYVPGSHRWGLLQKPELAGEMDGLKQFLTPEQQEAFQPIPIELKQGYATFHHPLMVHGSYANQSSRPRRAFVINVLGDGVYSDSDEPLLSGVPTIPKGQKIEGQFFPLLYQ
ncbi:MAG: phytanoyl-CoA dioxygenase family protein [Microscillaceae bacterium]|nr:phytanoyl-CoA dioxygenase family protein [Microscillaceae bacterium]